MLLYCKAISLGSIRTLDWRFSLCRSVMMFVLILLLFILTLVLVLVPWRASQRCRCSLGRATPPSPCRGSWFQAASCGAAHTSNTVRSSVCVCVCVCVCMCGVLVVSPWSTCVGSSWSKPPAACLVACRNTETQKKTQSDVSADGKLKRHHVQTLFKRCLRTKWTRRV